MGTNFYIRKKIKESDKRTIQELLDKDDMDGVAIYAKENPNEIHIGKRSYGWKFLWDAHEFRYFNPDVESIHEFLRSGTIVDEYGEEYTFEQFLDDIPIDEGYDIEEYYQNNCNELRHYESENTLKRFEQVTGIMPNKLGEFYVNKYRFTIHEDFA